MIIRKFWTILVLVVTAVAITRCKKKNSSCADYNPPGNCQFMLMKVSFNGAIITGDTTFGYQPVYVPDKTK